MPPKPIIYCETNWIVSLAFRHLQRHKEAKDLLDRASAAEFELRLPLTALIEAHRPIKDEANTFSSIWNTFRGLIQTAHENGYGQFDSIFRAMVGSSKQEKGAIRKIASAYVKEEQSNDVVRMLEQHQHVQILKDPNDAITKLTNIRDKVSFRGSDTADLFILAHVLADRAKEPPERPTILLSLDEKAFNPKNTKVSEQFYKDHHIAWCSSFNFMHAQERWREWFEGATPLNASSADLLTKEFTNCIHNAAIRAEQFELLFHKDAHVFDDNGYLVKAGDLLKKLKAKSLGENPTIQDGPTKFITEKIIDYAPGTSEGHRLILHLWNDDIRYWIMSLWWNS